MNPHPPAQTGVEHGPAPHQRAPGPHLVVRVAGAECGIDLDHVESVRIARLFRVLSFPVSDVIGLLDHRGERIPVVDLRDRVAPASACRPRGASHVVLRVRGRRVCVVVDSVGDLVDLDPVSISCGWHRGRHVALLDIDALIGDDVLEACRADHPTADPDDAC